MLFRRCLAALFGAALFGAFVLGLPCRASADAIVVAPFSAPSDFVIEFTITVTGAAAGPAGTVFNPFGLGYTVTAEIIGNATVFTYTPIEPPPIFNFGGLSLPQGQIPGLKPQSVDLYFQSSNQPFALPATGVSDNAAGGPDFLVLYAQESLQGGGSAGEWYELPFNPANSAITISNDESGPITLSDVGFLTSPTEIPLDQLNATDLPPSSFLSLASLDGAVVPSGGTVTASVTPEPAMLALWALGGAGLVLRRRRPAAKQGRGTRRRSGFLA